MTYLISQGPEKHSPWTYNHVKLDIFDAHTLEPIHMINTYGLYPCSPKDPHLLLSDFITQDYSVAHFTDMD